MGTKISCNSCRSCNVPEKRGGPDKFGHLDRQFLLLLLTGISSVVAGDSNLNATGPEEGVGAVGFRSLKVVVFGKSELRV